MNNSHPLAALTAEEIKKAVALFRSSKQTDSDSLFSYIALIEPDKEFIKNYSKGESFQDV